MSKFLRALWASPPKRRWSIVATIVIVLACIGGCQMRAGHSSQSENDELDRFYEVALGDFNISVLARGELDAIKNYTLRFEGAGKQGLTIEQMVEDKTKVKAGDPVVSFASEGYVESITGLEEQLHDTTVKYQESLRNKAELNDLQIRSLEESLDDAELNIDLFLESQSVARDKAISTLTEVGNAYELAQDSLNKYENLDYRTQSKSKQAAIDDREQAYYEAVDQLDIVSQALSEARLKDEATRQKAERDVSLAEKKVNSSMAAWETARKTDRQFRRYDHPQTLRRLLITADKTELDLKRNLVKAESDRVQAERRYRKLVRDQTQLKERLVEVNEQYIKDLEKLEADYLTQIERLSLRLTEFREDLAGLILRAPVDGLVSIGAPIKRGRTAKELTIGTKVSPKEVVARIPDLSQFLVRCDIPEIYRSRINPGQTTLLKNAALPELEMQGQVQTIASMSSRVLSWDPRSPRVYSTTISTNNSDPRLVPGMTVEVEILVESVKNVLHVPIEAIYNNEGKRYCKVKRKFSVEEQEIDTGRASNSHVEILNGLEAGDVVLLHVSSSAGHGSS